MKKLVFFLGGHDAEMCAIRNLLEEHGLAYHDKSLGWGAALSEYTEELNTITTETPVFVELKLDIPYPESSIIIDHHGKNAGKHKPVSIEQIAAMLNIELTRQQKLIAANDRAHIPGLKAAGATEKEIEEIRAYDRSCQGVTEKEEKQAEYLCQHFKSSVSLDVLEIPFTHTSPVTDRLHGKYRMKRLL